VDLNGEYTIADASTVSYKVQKEWVYKMKKSIMLGDYFNTNRVVKEYRKKAWGLK
jgi:hypothetical protein